MLLAELFKSTYDITYAQKHRMGSEAYFIDATGEKVTVELLEFDPPKEFKSTNVYGCSFIRKGTDGFTGDGKEVAILFATVFKALDTLIQKQKPVDVLFFSAIKDEKHNRARFYKKLVDRLAANRGFKLGAPAPIEQSILKLFGDGETMFFLTSNEYKEPD